MGFSLSEEEYLKIAEDAYDAGDLDRSLLFCRKLLEAFPQSVDGNLLLGDLYRDFGEAEIALKVYLGNFGNVSDDPDYLQSVIECLVDIRDFDDAEKYLQAYNGTIDEEELQDLYDYYEGLDELGEPRFRLATPGDEQAVMRAINKARAFLLKGEYTSARHELDSVDPDTEPLRRTLASAKIVTAIAEGNLDAVVAAGEDVKEDCEDIPTLCMLASAYVLQGDDENSDALIRKILTLTPDISPEIVQLLTYRIPDEHANHETLFCADLILSRFPHNLTAQMLKAQALFNLGSKEEAVEVMKGARADYGDLCDADYYLGVFEKLEDKKAFLNFSAKGVGASIETERHSLNRELNAASRMRLSQAQAKLAEDENLRNLFVRALRSPEEAINLKALSVLKKLRVPEARDILCRTMIDLRADKYTRLDCAVAVLTGWGELNEPVLVNYFWDEPSFYLPNNYPSMPPVFQAAYVDCIRAILSYAANPDKSAERLENAYSDLCIKQGELLFWNDSVDAKKAVRLRSVDALASALLITVSDGEYTAQEICDYFTAKPATVQKYMKILGLEV